MLTDKQLSLRAVGTELAGAFLSTILLFSYHMLFVTDSGMHWFYYVGGAFLTLAYFVLIYGTTWQYGFKDADRERYAPETLSKARPYKMCLAMLIPNIIILTICVIALRQKFLGNTQNTVLVSELLRTFWFAPYFEWMYPLASGPKAPSLYPLLLLFAIPGPIVAFIGYKLGRLEFSVKNLILSILPNHKNTDEYPAQKKKIAKDILTDKNYHNIYRKKPPRE